MENNHVNKRVWAVSIGLLMVLATVPSMQAGPVEVVEETADEVLMETGMDSCASATNDTIHDGDAPDNATATCRAGVASTLQDASSRQQQVVCGVNSPPSCWVELVMEAACGENGDCVERPCEDQTFQDCLLGDEECEPDEVGIPPYCAKKLELHDVRPCRDGDVGVVVEGNEYCTDPDPGNCPAGEVGVPPYCVEAQSCSNGQYGVVLEKSEYCIDPDPGECEDDEIGVPPLCEPNPCGDGMNPVLMPDPRDLSVCGQGPCTTPSLSEACTLLDLMWAAPVDVKAGGVIEGECVGQQRYHHVEVEYSSEAEVTGLWGVVGISAGSSTSLASDVAMSYSYACDFILRASALGTGATARLVTVSVPGEAGACEYPSVGGGLSYCKAEVKPGQAGAGGNGAVFVGSDYPSEIEVCVEATVVGTNSPMFLGAPGVTDSFEMGCSTFAIHYTVVDQLQPVSDMVFDLVGSI